MSRFGAGVCQTGFVVRDATGEPVEENGWNGDHQAVSGNDESLTNRCSDGAEPRPSEAIKVNAFRIPSTVPSSPIKGAVEPVEARMFMPRLGSR